MNKWISGIFFSIAAVTHIQAQTQFQKVDSAFTLKEAIEFGLGFHPTMRLAHNSVEQSRQTSRQKVAGYLPQVNVSSGLDYNFKLQQNIIPPGIFGPEEQRITFGTKFTSSTAIQLDQTLYDQSLLVGIEANKPYEELEELEINKTEETLIYNVANAYYSVLVAQEQMKLLQANRSRFRDLLRIISLQSDYGVVNNVDVNQVEVNLSNIESQLSILSNNIALAYNQLKNAMGLSQDAHIIIADSSKIIDQAITQQQLQAGNDFDFTKTIAYQEKNLTMRLLDLNIKSIRYEALPKLSFYARYGANGFGNDNILQAYDPLLDFGSMGLKITWNVFSGFGRDARIKSAIIDKDNYMTNMEITEEMMKLQFNNSKNNLIRARSTIETNKQNVELAQKVYDNTNLQYKEGVASLSQLLNAELSLREANNNYTQSLIDFFKADLELNKSNGTLKEFLSTLD